MSEQLFHMRTLDILLDINLKYVKILEQIFKASNLSAQ